MLSSSPPPFSAVLLAGGKSSRMGADKAALEFDGQMLWERQVATLRATEPREIFISGLANGPYRDAGIPILEDAQPGLGPLAGLSVALRCAAHSPVLVLAIDLPAITSAFLSKMLRSLESAEIGVVPRQDNLFEPLAALYPRAVLPLVEEVLRSEDRSLQHVISKAIDQGSMRIHEIEPGEQALFWNVNRPTDLARFPQSR